MITHSITSLTCIAAIASALSGCSTTIALTPKDQVSGAKVSIKDKREKSETIYRRDGALEPIQYFGDSDFNTLPLTFLGKSLERTLPKNEYEIEISKFRVIDIFPRRLNAGISGAAFGALSSMGYSVFLPNISPQAPDNITCIAVGTLQGKPFSSSSSVPYAISPFAGLVKNDSSFLAATNGCFNKLAEQIAKSL